MKKSDNTGWEKQVVAPQKVIEMIEPGMSIYLGTGVGEPRTLVKHLMAAKGANLKDLELIQLVSLADAISLKALKTNTYRLKTFYSGYVAGEAITAGMVDLIPSSFSKIPRLIESGRIPIDAAFVQITPPDEAGYCSLGVAVDVVRQAMEKASLIVGEINTQNTFKQGVKVRFRAIKPSDEEEMRRLFYRFSDQSVYYRYFAPIKVMPHSKMQEYVNVDFSQVLSIVGLVGESGQGHIIAEARFIKDQHRPGADVAFVVDERYQGLGVASYLYKMLIRCAKERGIKGFTADILASNKAMMNVFEKGGEIINAKLEYGVYHLEIPFSLEGSSK